jgi:hypothetical protein
VDTCSAQARQAQLDRLTSQNDDTSILKRAPFYTIKDTDGESKSYSTADRIETSAMGFENIHVHQGMVLNPSRVPLKSSCLARHL